MVVRKYKKGDGQDLFALVERNNNCQFLWANVEEVASLKTKTEAEIMVRKHEAEWVGRLRFVMGVWLKDENKYVGQIWIEPDKWDVPSFEIGWFVDGGYEGMGVAAESARRCLEFLFDNLKAHRVSAIMRDTSPRSWKLAERLGFRREGHLRECRVENGIRYGLVRYGMLNTEFPGTVAAAI
ncbi:MAG: GNAT family N-acetyltransferase [Chloroflexi bacterium]|nr:GNAT family N-acetyltransferase [Chloroflexota bacterium]